MRRGEDKRRLMTVAVLAVCVLVAGGGVALIASRHHAAPPVPVVTLSPTPSAASPAPVTSTQSLSPLPVAPSTTPATTPSTGPAVRGLHLVPGPYGFEIPQGWTVGPVQSPSATVQRVHVSDPASTSAIDYLADKTVAIYNPDHTVNLTIVGAAITCNATSSRYVPDRGPRYTCTPQGGHNVSGAILIQPYPQGFKLLQVMLPPEENQAADAILSGFQS